MVPVTIIRYVYLYSCPKLIKALRHVLVLELWLFIPDPEQPALFGELFVFVFVLVFLLVSVIVFVLVSEFVFVLVLVYVALT